MRNSENPDTFRSACASEEWAGTGRREAAAICLLCAVPGKITGASKKRGVNDDDIAYDVILDFYLNS